MEEIHSKRRQRHQSTIKYTKVDFMSDEIASPALTKLDGAIDVSDHDAGCSERRSEGVNSRIRHFACAEKEQQPENAEDGHRDELEADTAQHDVCACIEVAWGALTGSFCSHRASGSLGEDGDDVGEAENDEVEFWWEEAVAAAVGLDELGEDVIDCCGEEARSWFR